MNCLKTYYRVNNSTPSFGLFFLCLSFLFSFLFSFSSFCLLPWLFRTLSNRGCLLGNAKMVCTQFQIVRIRCVSFEENAHTHEQLFHKSMSLHRYSHLRFNKCNKFSANRCPIRHNAFTFNYYKHEIFQWWMNVEVSKYMCFCQM